ncbi:MAG: hypothetical protein ACK58T_09430, partial [Phycisphaerae bacterium]
MGVPDQKSPQAIQASLHELNQDPGIVRISGYILNIRANETGEDVTHDGIIDQAIVSPLCPKGMF